MAKVLYAGSFDPITYGHLDIIKSGAAIFEKIIVGVAYNCNKQGLIPVEKRMVLIKECVKDFSNVEVVSYEGLTIEYAKKIGASVLLRGLRNSTDFEYEKELAQINSKLDSEITTVCLIAKPEHSCISSSAVKEIFANHGNISKFVPYNVEYYLKKNFSCDI